MVFHKERWSTFPRDKRQVWKHPADAGNQTSRSNRTSVCLYAFWSATDNSRLRPQCHYLSWRKVCLDAKCTWKKWRASCLLLESKCDDTGSGWASWEILFRIEKLQCHSQLIPHKGERSRLGGKRRKRSCVELKDPPPTLPQNENVLVMPVYDSTTDQKNLKSGYHLVVE